MSRTLPRAVGRSVAITALCLLIGTLLGCVIDAFVHDPEGRGLAAIALVDVLIVFALLVRVLYLYLNFTPPTEPTAPRPPSRVLIWGAMLWGIGAYLSAAFSAVSAILYGWHRGKIVGCITGMVWGSVLLWAAARLRARRERLLVGSLTAVSLSPSIEPNDA